jgi:hypothetical protein
LQFIHLVLALSTPPTKIRCRAYLMNQVYSDSFNLWRDPLELS